MITGCSKPTVKTKEEDTKEHYDPDISTEKLGAVNCTGERCLVVEASSEYCSVDPQDMPTSNYFATKSRLLIEAGSYPLDFVTEELPKIPITIITPSGNAALLPTSNPKYEIKPYQEAPLRQETISLKNQPNLYTSDTIALSRLFLIATNIDVVWKDAHFRLGNSDDVWWWYAATRGVSTVLEGNSTLFPKLTGVTQIEFAPCELEGQPDDMFVFELMTGETLRLKVRSFSTTSGTGHYLGRLLEAEGSFAGQSIAVENMEDLAFFGSWDATETAMPGLVVRWAEIDNSCGIILDPHNDTDWNWGGWKAYRLTCDGKKGVEVPLKNVEHPQKYSSP